MLENIQKKMMNGYIAKDLTQMVHEVPKNFSRVMDMQCERVQKLAKRAYRIPFYRERFEACGCTPDDFHSAEDLAKFPVMTRADLRTWMQEVLKDYDEASGQQSAQKHRFSHI